MSGSGAENAGERGAARFAAREARGVFVAGEAEFVEQRLRDMRIVERPEARLDIGRAPWRSRRNPAPAADSAATRRAAESARPRPRSISPAAILSSVDLPEPLRPTTHDPRAGRDGEIGAFEQRLAAEREHDALEGEEGRRGHWKLSSVL